MAFDYETLDCSVDEQGILHIILNRPDKLNSLTDQCLTELGEVFQQAEQDQSVTSILLSGAGKVFCAGADINRLAQLDVSQGLHFAKHGQQVFKHLEDLSKPSVAAIHGVACGGGCELAMAASLRIASDDARFAQPEVKLGIIPGYGGTQRLSRLVGKGRAMDMCITGRFIDADTGLNWGLINEISPPDQLISKAKSLLHTILANGPLAVASAMFVINSGYDLPLEQALALEADQFALTCATEDKAIGVQAFLDKQDAKFKRQ